MTTGKSGKVLSQVKQCTKTRENSKTPCCQARNTGLKEEVTVDERSISKTKLINILAHAIQQVTEMDDRNLMLKEGKIKFRQYERIECNWDRLRAIDITIEA